MLFQKMELSEKTMNYLAKEQFLTATPIQEKVIPVVINTRKNVIGQARTGTGKTLAFSIPLVELLDPRKKVVQAIIIVPTRELCKQVNTVLAALSRNHGFRTVEVYGGVSLEPQIKKIKEGAQIIIATPGRLIDLYNRSIIHENNIRFIVLDEADRMLDMGFFPDIEYILKKILKRATPRILLFSATMLKHVGRLIRKFVSRDEIIEINVSRDSITVEGVKQYYYRARENKDKYNILVKVLRHERPRYSLIFVNTKKMAKILAQRLKNDHRVRVRTETINGDMTQKQRERVMAQFKHKKINCLIATNVAARGLDFQGLTHVINYDLPENPEDYVHRIGRTARMESSGVAISIVTDRQFKYLDKIEEFTNKRVIQRSSQTHKAFDDKETIGPKYAIINDYTPGKINY